ncbi:hypothetical protein N7474_000971 [Penicillium riverlandense]|uniref:uncharacterized protein n=1 Tax=Penicillium riverlandense TaxID=1903569 RepID=UPI002547B177|nr:uncharacterized protein N7474_000971 [Penicillium riverlandense]KAJ5832660.1 hypothetical protein N7474_000971 [Penicillium riverlandense]
MKLVSLAAGLLIPVLVYAAPTSSNPVNPKVKGTPQVLGLVTDPSLDRDSCGSAKFNDRVLWVCRDTQNWGPNGLPTFPLITSSASWTEYNSHGGPRLVTPAGADTAEYLMYGDNNNQAFYPLVYDECNETQSGQCGDLSRYALWPDSPPMVTMTNPDASVLAYTWVKKSHIMPDLSTLIADPATSLYRVNYVPYRDGPTGLPQVEIVNETFWGENEIPYGDYGNVVQDGTAYLYGQNSNGTIALAKVDPLDIEKKWMYEYWDDGSWTSQQPASDDPSINIPNVTAGGQGTFYWSDSWQSFVWIGQHSRSVSADFYITTAPKPQGPWTEPVNFYSGVNGNYTLGAYTLQAHPSLTTPWGNDIYLTYTKTDVVDGQAIYSHPLIHVQWE